MKYYVEFETIVCGFEVEAESPEQAVQSAKALAIETLEDDIRHKNLRCEPT